MAVTAEDIARACGVSRPTVSRILNNTALPYHPRTRQRVVEAAQRLGYFPHASARAMACKEVSNLGLLVGTEPTRSVMAHILPGVQREMLKRNLHLTVAELPDAQLTDEGYVPRLLKEFAVSGFLVNYTHQIPPKMLELIDKLLIPSVWLNAKLDHDAVYPDDFAAGLGLVRHLVQLGHRRIGYFTAAHTEHYSHVDRYAGYLAGMREAGLPPIDLRSMRYLTGHEDLMRHAARAIGGDRPSALVTYNHEDAMHVYLIALQQGLRVPRDLSIATNSWPVPSALGRAFTTMQTPFVEVGGRGVAMLLERISAPDEPLASVAVPPTLYVGDTTAPSQ